MTDNVYFVTDGTMYHDGDVEEVYGVIITSYSKDAIMQLLAQIPNEGDVAAAIGRLCSTTTGIKFIAYDWELETNRVVCGQHD